MAILNKSQANVLFEREAVLIGSEDRIPEARACALFGADAVEFAKRHGHWNGFGVGDFTMGYLTRQGFMDAVSYANVQQLRAVEKEGTV